MKLPSFLLSATLTCAVLGYASMASAADDPVVVQARARFKEGVAFFDAGKFDEARTAFLQAYSLKPHPAVLLNLAQSELRGGRKVDAANHFAEYLANSTAVKPAERSSAEKGLAEAKQGIGELTISVDTPGSEVFIDGASVGKAPLPRAYYVSAGEHLIEAKDGERSATARSIALAGTAKVVPLDLSAPPPAALPPTDPAPVAVAPATTQTSFEPTAEPSLDYGDSRPPFFDWLFHSPVGLTGLGVTVVGVGVGITGTIVSNSRYDSADEAENKIVERARADNDSGVICQDGTSPSSVYAPACAERQDRLDSGDAWRTASVIGYATAAVSAAGTVIYYLVATKGEEPSGSERAASAQRPSLVPILSADLRALSLQGSF